MAELGDPPLPPGAPCRVKVKQGWGSQGKQRPEGRPCTCHFTSLCLSVLFCKFHWDCKVPEERACAVWYLVYPRYLAHSRHRVRGKWQSRRTDGGKPKQSGGLPAGPESAPPGGGAEGDGGSHGRSLNRGRAGAKCASERWQPGGGRPVRWLAEGQETSQLQRGELGRLATEWGKVGGLGDCPPPSQRWWKKAYRQRH